MKNLQDVMNLVFNITVPARQPKSRAPYYDERLRADLKFRVQGLEEVNQNFEDCQENADSSRTEIRADSNQAHHTEDSQESEYPRELLLIRSSWKFLICC